MKEFNVTIWAENQRGMLEFNIEADNEEEAMKKAEDMLNFNITLIED